MGWSEKYKKSIDCSNPKGFSQRTHCQGRKKKLKEQFKPFKTVEEIAKKHRLDVSFIQKQLDMGEPIEHEHTKNHELARKIALQHLDEIPDYYTRLKKMEMDAKKHHNKFKDVKVNFDGAVKKLESDLKKLDDTSYDSIDKLMRGIMKKYNMTAKELHNAFVDKHNKTPDDWIKELKEGTLHHWFKGSKSKDGKPGWVQADGSPCANEPGETSTPKCFSSARLKALKAKGEKGEALIKSAVRRKRQKDKGQQAKSGGAKPTNVPTFVKGKENPNYVKAEPGIKEEMELNESAKDKPGKGSGKKDACYHKVRARYDVWPSAYASGALVKCRKVGAKNWGTKSEETQMIRYCPKCKKNETRDECKYGVKYWDMFSMPPALTANQLKYNPTRPHPGNFPESYDHEHSMARSEISTIISAAKRLKKKMKGEGNIEAWVQSKITKAADYLDTAADYIDSGEHNVKEDCWTGYKQVGMKKKGKKVVPNCVPTSEQISFEIGAGHRQAQRQAKIRNLATGTTNPGEKAAAERKLQGPKLPLADDYQLKTFNQFMEDWQKVNKQDKTDGMSQKAVNAYRRENPGSKLKTAVTEKNPGPGRSKRRKSFCARSKGQQDMHNIDCSKTPDKDICKARRRWRC